MKIKSVDESYADPETRRWLEDNFERHQKEGWQVWQEPWFRREHPVMYRVNLMLQRFGL